MSIQWIAWYVLSTLFYWGIVLSSFFEQTGPGLHQVGREGDGVLLYINVFQYKLDTELYSLWYQSLYRFDSAQRKIVSVKYVLLEFIELPCHHKIKLTKGIFNALAKASVLTEAGLHYSTTWIWFHHLLIRNIFGCSRQYYHNWRERMNCAKLLLACNAGVFYGRA